MWFVALQPCQGQPCDCFEHLLVITLSTWAKPLRKKNGAHIVKRGIRIMLLLLGIPPKLIFFRSIQWMTSSFCANKWRTSGLGDSLGTLSHPDPQQKAPGTCGAQEVGTVLCWAER